MKIIILTILFSLIFISIQQPKVTDVTSCGSSTPDKEEDCNEGSKPRNVSYCCYAEYKFNKEIEGAKKGKACFGLTSFEYENIENYRNIYEAYGETVAALYDAKVKDFKIKCGSKFLENLKNVKFYLLFLLIDILL